MTNELLRNGDVTEHKKRAYGYLSRPFSGLGKQGDHPRRSKLSLEPAVPQHSSNKKERDGSVNNKHKNMNHY